MTRLSHSGTCSSTSANCSAYCLTCQIKIVWDALKTSKDLIFFCNPYLNPVLMKMHDKEWRLTVAC